MKKTKIKVFYDEECPFCKSYSKYIKLKAKYDLKLFDARQNLDEINSLRNKGFDINNGIIVVIDTKIYQGAEAIKALNNLSIKKVFLFDTRFFETIFYPFVKYIRVLILKILRKKVKID